MANQSTLKLELPDMASVLRAIHKDPVEEREDKASQMVLFRRLVQEKARRDLSEEDLEANANRLRERVRRHYSAHAMRTEPRKRWYRNRFETRFERPPFHQLFFFGTNIFPEQHLLKLDIGYDSRDESEDDGDGEEEVRTTSLAKANGRAASPQQGRQGSRTDIDHSDAPRIQTESNGQNHHTSAERSPKRPRLEPSLAAEKSASGIEAAPAAASPDAYQKSSGSGFGQRYGVEPQASESQPGSSFPSTGTREAIAGPPQSLFQAPAKTLPGQNVTIPHQDWVQSQMRAIESGIWHAALAYFQEKDKAEQATSNFVREPEADLRAVYKQLFGQDWQIKACDASPHLRQIYLTQALFGAAVHRAVLDNEHDWDLARQIQAALGEHHQYFGAALAEAGQGAGELLKDVACRQASDPEYHKTVVSEHARRLAGSTAFTLLPHLQLLSGRTAPVEPMKYKRWVKYLEDAYSAAITLKQVTMASDFGPFVIKWAEAGERVDTDCHKLSYDLDQASTEDATIKVLHGVLPSISRQTEDELLVYCTSLVVPLASKPTDP